ncbi:hypothetical protein DFH07DRAFT_799435 [Mycena maculata]|uniref:Uncharacterized protein n=1 Tax=Mycena maculata TaxID=230809 RepID=A0AAD7K2R3_9AGAR|nr:hypothetical protein DFH07DRAFT_799435 [Mycena maculata]
MLTCILWRRLTAGKLVFAVLVVISPIAARFLWMKGPRHVLRPFLKFLRPSKKYRTYLNALEEAQYWAAAELHGRRLRSSDARFAGSRGGEKAHIPVITSYTPALLPYYRQVQRSGRNLIPEYYLSLRSLCKWHRMVFPGPWHPTVAQASRMRQAFSVADLQEIHRISQMVPDEKVFGEKARWKPKYHGIWMGWLARDERRMHVVFEA